LRGFLRGLLPQQRRRRCRLRCGGTWVFRTHERATTNPSRERLFL
jgi:hypothetical protein